MDDKPKNRLKDYAKYSSLAFQMMSIIVIGTFAGLKLDQYTNFKFPLFTLLLSLISVFSAIYIGIKDFIKKK
jgi:F0F1-type ATP synthase assembly protein I